MNNQKNKRLTDHFDGKRFFNAGVSFRNFSHVLKWKLTSTPIPWPSSRENIYEAKPDRRMQNDEEIGLTFVNHSTMLIQWGKINMLTDPIWGKRAGPFNFLGPRRIHPPGIAFENLPPIDIILLSHNHYDHLDIATLKRLSKVHRPYIVTGLGNLKWLASRGIEKVIEFDWWQRSELLNTLEIVFIPAQHFSARSVFDINKTLWGGFALKKGESWIYYSGDTGYCNVFKQVRDKFGPMRLALLPIGAYKPRWFMKTVHMSPEEAVQAHMDLHADRSAAMHYGTFHLSDEGIDEPCLALQLEMERRGIDSDKFWILSPGEFRRLPYGS